MTVESRIDENVFNFYSLPPGREVERRSALSLLSPARLDIVARYIFVRQYMLGWGLGWGTHVYREFLESYNPEFLDGDGRKASFSDYLENLTALIAAMSRHGYDADRGLIPYVDDTIVDGAHRVAAAIHFGHDVEAVRLEGPPQHMDASALLDAGLSRGTVEHLACEYARLDTSTYVATLFPSSTKRAERALNLIGENAEIVYQREIALTTLGRVNVIKLLYGHEPWWDDSHIDSFVQLRFPRGGGILAVMFRTPDRAHSRPVKEVVRTAFEDDHYVHMNDTHDETVWIADALFNRNGRQYINHAQRVVPARFAEFESAFRQLRQTNPRLEHACIDAGGVLAAFGLRDSNDLDFIVPTRAAEMALQDLPEGTDCHNSEYRGFAIPVDEIIASPHHHFLYKGVRYMALDSVLLFKKWRDAEKDRRDVLLIIGANQQPDPIALAHTDRLWMVLTKARDKVAVLGSKTLGWSVLRLRRVLPESVYSALRSIYRRLTGASASDSDAQ